MIKIDTPLTDKEQIECDSIIDELLKAAYIVRDKDKASRSRYNMIVRNEAGAYISTILFHCRRELVINESAHVAYARSITDKDRELSKEETILILRLLQRILMSRTSASSVFHIDYAELESILKETYGTQPKKGATQELLSRLQKLNFIENDRKSEMITIYPSVFCLMDENTLQAVNKYISDLELKKEA